MHFAAEALVAKSVREPSIFYATNVACGVNLLDAVTRHGVKKFIFSSTAATYGEPEIVPIPEDHRKAPINPYGKSKLVFEQILADYKTYTQLNYVALRYFNAAGASKELGENRSEEHTSELQSQSNLVCRLLLEKKKNIQHIFILLK